MPRHLTQSCLLAIVCTWGACHNARIGDQLAFSIEGVAGSGERRVTLRDLVFEPVENVQTAKLDARGRLIVLRADREQALTVRAKDLCPVTVGPGPQPAALPLQPVLDLGGDRTGVGFDARIQVRARHNCPELGAGQITWRQLEGPALGELELSADGRELSARMPSFAALHPEPLPQGVVPISPRTQGRVVLEATWRAQGQEATRAVTLTAAARSTGLSSIAVSQPIVIAGSGWHVERRPPGAKATVQALDGLTFFSADMPGGWTLRNDAPGHEPAVLKLNSLTHDATPYDCARSECHAQLSALAASTPMSHALDRFLKEPGDAAAVSCMLDCHVLGERALSDGGFHAVAARLGFTWTEHTRWDDLPQALRRLGGVRCTGCHGPGAIPPPDQRSAILRSDVCASCHDAPPRYVHVTEWRSGAMARSDQSADTRALPCARCHTTAGFLAHNGDRKRADEPQTMAARDARGDVAATRVLPRMAAEHVVGGAARGATSGATGEVIGIACAACHAPHAEDRGPRLVRGVVAGSLSEHDLFAEPRTRLCRSCHAPAAGDADLSGAAAPSGTLAAADVLVPAVSGAGWERMHTPFAHAQVEKGCVGCHGGAALGEGHVNHSFRAEPRVCGSCHVGDARQSGSQAARSLQLQAQQLSEVVARFCDASPEPRLPHSRLEPGRCESKALERAQYELDLVLEDDAAVFHNAELARALITDAELQLRKHTGS